MRGGLTTTPTPGAERVKLSAYPAHMFLKSIVQDKHSSDHSYSNPVESKQIAG